MSKNESYIRILCYQRLVFTALATFFITRMNKQRHFQLTSDIYYLRKLRSFRFPIVFVQKSIPKVQKMAEQCK